MISGEKKTAQYREPGNCRGAKGFQKQIWRCWSVFSCSEDASLRADGAPETIVYLKVNLFTLLQWHADCLITARNKNIMWARAFAPHPAALFAGTQVVRRRLFSLPIFDSRHIKWNGRKDTSWYVTDKYGCAQKEFKYEVLFGGNGCVLYSRQISI